MNELISVRIPNSNKWKLKDIEKKAKDYGLEKSEFILNAIDMMMNFDEVFFKKIQKYSDGLHIPEWLVLQNMIIKRMAEEAAFYEAWGSRKKILTEFASGGDDMEHQRMFTGEELFNMLKAQFFDEEKKKRLDIIEKNVLQYGMATINDIKFVKKYDSVFYKNNKDKIDHILKEFLSRNLEGDN